MTWNPLFHTLDLFGFYLPPVLLWALVALLPFFALSRLAQACGLYAFVWHRPLFDAALYVIVLVALTLGLPLLTGGPA
ncbi:DUF1656 domain-containing protein [Ancylobacter polymorphus]|jgi:hypothetical protein|uniref:DUF1656 domain-containing protein n=1 Tax=Ancylobacter polymorphus TaxID=223390 RepID=A0A9E7CVT6_9HYPH|nr:DUF1656 domain-containing protein [Ancylobacter polymorphus]MDQ0302446.1 hypothetical protein [Ancylobacter polymorphus]MPT24768.1 DUF1656 domain-containing protein [Starkeya sp.]UOK71573.1 DUF1656 domain-containing protein [Ancylobacter polymorphus]